MARKNKKKRGDISGAELQERRQRQLEERRLAREAAALAAHRQARRDRLIRFAMIGLVLVGFIWFVFVRGKAPGDILGHKVEKFASSGVGQHGEESTLGFETIPPVSGTHAPGPAACGVHDEQIPDGQQVHSLEHGAVAIQFQPDLAPDDIKVMEEIARNSDDNVLSAPYAGMETPITVSSWSRLMRLDELDAPAIRDYIEEFGDKPQESGQTCPNDVDRPFEPAASPSPVPSVIPSVLPSPSDDGGGNGNGDGGGNGNGDGGGNEGSDPTPSP